MFTLYELEERMDRDEQEHAASPELVSLIVKLAEDIRAEVRRERFRGARAEAEFYRRFNEAIDPFEV